ncbi:hypothetical protein KKG46_00070, partial [Patescibacteria group bacterium]|nr:hypothetical protein [Patescibacteria group bacterium]
STTTREDFICNPEANNPKRAISYRDYGKDGSKFIEETNETSDGKKTKFNIQIIAPNKSGGKYIASCISYRVTLADNSRYLSFIITNHGKPLLEINEINDKETKGIEKDGLHVENHEQTMWYVAWSNFFNNLTSDSVFLNALESSKFISSNSIQRFPDPTTIDLEKYVADLEMLWNNAYSTKIFKKKFPRHLAPFNLGPYPNDTIIPHKEVQRIIQFTINHLTENVRLLDEHQFPDKPNPYR